MSKDIFTQLKKLRTEPRAGYVSEEKRARGRERLMAAIAPTQPTAVVWAPAATFDFIRFTFSDVLAKPATAFASFAVLIFGSLTTVSAASQSLPGDTLYSIKLVSERAQLSLTSADKKAVLHTEFAERRLQEITELTTTGSANNELVASTVDAFKREVRSATQEIQNLNSGSSDRLLAQVSEVNKKFVALNDSASQTLLAQVPTLSEDLRNTTASATETVTNTAVVVYENEPKPASEDELKKIYRDRLNKIIQRRTLSMGRVQVIESNDLFYKVSSRRETGVLYTQIEKIADTMSDSSSLVARGDYRTAFENLRQVEEVLTGIESELLAIEAKLIEAHAEKPVIDIPTPVEPTESVPPSNSTDAPETP